MRIYGQATGRNDPGFTLVEILAALAVLVIGLTSVISVVFASKRLADSALDRNNARAIITEAVNDIYLNHLIPLSGTMNGLAVAPPASNAGLLLETLAYSPNPNIHSTSLTPYKNVDIYATNFNDQWNAYCNLPAINVVAVNQLPPNPPTAVGNTMLWPYGSAPKYAAGSPGIGLTVTTPALAYRVIYRLERHPLWHTHTDSTYNTAPNADSGYEGVYILTLVVYRDMDGKGGRLAQVTDPVMVYLRDQHVWSGF